jgi:hypothetical protein
MVVSEENNNRVDKDSARSFVLTCLRSGVRLDLKPKKSTTGLVAHVRQINADARAILVTFVRVY